MKNIVKLLRMFLLCVIIGFISCSDPFTGTSIGGVGKDGISPTGPIIDGVFTVANLTQWNETVTTISNSGNNKRYAINITDSFSVPGSTNNTFGSVTGVNITISGNHTLTLQSETKGNLLLIAGDQTVFIQELKLSGHPNNNDSLVKVMGSFTMQGSASVSGNTNAGGDGGGVYIGNGSSFVMEDYATVSGNTANKGGGLYINADSNVEILGGNVYGNDNTVIPALRNTAVMGAAFYITDGSDSFFFDENITQEPNAVTFEDLTANDGSLTETTTELTLSFSRAIPGLTVDDINLSGVSGANNITKTLSGSGPTYTLIIGNVTVGGNLTVTVQKSDFNISPASMSAEIISASIFNVANLTQWNNAKSAIANGGNNRSYTINATDNFSIPGSTDYTFGYVTDVNIIICGNNTLTLQAGTQGHLLRIGSNQSVVMRDISLVGHISNNVPLVKNSGTFIMQGSAVISNNSSNPWGGGVYVDYGGVFIMEGNTSVTGNTAGGGGGVYVCGYGSTFTMRNNSSVQNNKSIYGGGVMLNGDLEKYGKTTFTMHDNSIISGNEASDGSGGWGGGVCVWGGTFTMYDNSIISGNNAHIFGGGVYLASFSASNDARFRFAGGTVYGSEGSVLSNLRNTTIYYTGRGASLFLTLESPDTATYGGPDGTSFSFYEYLVSLGYTRGPYENENTITITGNMVTPILTLPPTTPTNVRLFERTPATATISWNVVSYATDYLVYRSTSPTGSFSLVGITSSAETQFTDGPLSASTTYYYRVSARNNFGASEQSSTISVPVRSIDGLIATALSTSNSIVIEWPVDPLVNQSIDMTNIAHILTIGSWGLETAYIVESKDGFNNWIRVGKNVIPTTLGFTTGTGKHYFVDKNLGQGLHIYRSYIEVKQKLFGITIQTHRTESYQISATIP